MAWWNFGITQAHGVGGEQGIDIGTPFHTPITAVASGRVTQAGYGPWGGDIKLTAPSLNAAGIFGQEYLHPDVLLAHVGDWIMAGQVIGFSGGQLSGGYHPAQAPFSTGAHTEFDVMNAAGRYVDPTALLSQLRSGSYNPAQGVQDYLGNVSQLFGMQAGSKSASLPGGIPPAIQAGLTGAAGPAIGDAAKRAQDAAGGLAVGAASATTQAVIGGALGAFGFKSPSDFSQRLLLGILGFALFMMGVILFGLASGRKIIGGAVQSVGGTQGIASLAKVAAK